MILSASSGRLGPNRSVISHRGALRPRSMAPDRFSTGLDPRPRRSRRTTGLLLDLPRWPGWAPSLRAGCGGIAAGGHTPATPRPRRRSASALSGMASPGQATDQVAPEASASHRGHGRHGHVRPVAARRHTPLPAVGGGLVLRTFSDSLAHLFHTSRGLLALRRTARPPGGRALPCTPLNGAGNQPRRAAASAHGRIRGFGAVPAAAACMRSGRGLGRTPRGAAADRPSGPARKSDTPPPQPTTPILPSKPIPFGEPPPKRG